MVEIKRIGSYLEVDEQGYLVKAADTSRIQNRWRGAVETVKQAYLDRRGGAVHSVYVRGSLAKGCAVEGVSDVDSFAVLREGEPKGSDDPG